MNISHLNITMTLDLCMRRPPLATPPSWGKYLPKRKKKKKPLASWIKLLPIAGCGKKKGPSRKDHPPSPLAPRYVIELAKLSQGIGKRIIYSFNRGLICAGTRYEPLRDLQSQAYGSMADYFIREGKDGRHRVFSMASVYIKKAKKAGTRGIFSGGSYRSVFEVTKGVHRYTRLYSYFL